MTDTLREFYECLNREEDALAEEVASDRLGLIMRVAINELDLDAEEVSSGKLSPSIAQERAYVFRIGAVRVIKLALQAHEAFDAPTLTFQRNIELSAAVLGLIGRAGSIEHGRRVAQSLSAIGGAIEREEDSFQITLPAEIADLELHERELERYHVGRERSLFVERYEATIGKHIGEEVRSLLSELVYPFREHFIGYEAHPDLDAYFFGHAYNEMMLSKGFDTFHFSTEFGGITFSNYKLGATFIVSVANKHRAFVRALLEKEPSIRIEDVLTVSVETAGFLEGLREFINHFGAHIIGHVPVTEDDTRKIFDVLSVSREQLDMLDRPGAPIPPLIQCSADHVIRPLAGAESSDVMLFLLNSLQHRFSKDYDRAQQAREGVMQRAITGQLHSVLPNLKFHTNVRLRRDGKLLTDVDLVVVDGAERHVVLVQLKHQDPYGADLATMLARTRRLNEQVSKWLQTVSSWLEAVEKAHLKSTFQLPSDMSEPKVSLLVMARHYAYSIRSVFDVDEGAFCNWNQFITAVARLKAREDMPRNVSDLIQELNSLSAPKKEHYLPEPRTVWAVGDLRFTIEQEAS